MHDYYRSTRLGFGGRGLTDTVKKLMIANGIVFVLQLFTSHQYDLLFALTTRFAINRLYLWQFFTYMFMHGDIMHIGFNMYILWMFGGEVERMWGPQAFFRYFVITGLGAGLLHALVSSYPTVGASGAIMGVMVAYALMFPERRIMLIFPPVVLPARTLVLIMAGIDLLLGMRGSQDGVAHFAHLGGALVGYLYLKQDWRSDHYLSEISKWFRQKRIRVVRNGKEENPQDLDELKRLVDELLDKANEVGIENLTAKEKSLLKKASKILKRER